jgi:RNA polymerase sigma-70 factor (ECF subfamily)
VRLGRVVTFESFYRRELAGVVALARALCGPSHADDVAQEAMLAAYRRWDDVQHLDRPGAWVRRVAVNMATSTLRRRAVEAKALLRLGARPSVAAELEPTTEDFWAEVRRLPRRQAQVVALHYLDDMSVGDVAATLGCAEGTVKQHLSRARTALAAGLAGWQDPVDEGEDTA